MKRFLASLTCAFLLSASAVGQSAPGQSSPGQSALSATLSSGPSGSHGTMHFGRPFSGTAITGAPFSAEEFSEDVHTLADGTHIRHTMAGMKTYRDSMGRTRKEHPVFRGPLERPGNLPKGPTIVEITDPVAHVKYVFDLDEPVAHRQELPASGSRIAPSAAQRGHAAISSSTGLTAVAGGLGEADTASTSTETATATTTRGVAPLLERRQRGDAETRPQTTTEHLGTEIIEGIPAEGTRHTTTWPVGAMGNDRPITHASEEWVSPELKEVILSTSDDPRSGERTRKLINISRDEPDPSLFEPPPGYTVKDEKEEFTIEWGGPR